MRGGSLKRNYTPQNHRNSRYQWPCGLRIRSAASLLLRLGVRMPRGHGFWSLKFVVSCVSSDFRYGQITCLEELYRVRARLRVCLCLFVIHTHARTHTHTHTCPIWVVVPGKNSWKNGRYVDRP